jgi:sugar/nucleoside kinase (ribokinase family)
MDSGSLRGILCAGNIVHDTLVRPVDRLQWSTTTWVEEIHASLGGNGAATSYTLGKLGVPVRLLSIVGSDAPGNELLRRLESAGVDVSRVTRSEAPTAATIALVHSGGDRLFLHRPGASGAAFRESIQFTPEILRGISRFHLANVFALPLLRPHAAETLRRAKTAGLDTSLDTGWDALGRWMEDLGPCLPSVDVLFVNESEARMLSGRSGIEEAAAALLDSGAGRVVVKLGAQGCAVFTGGEEFRVPAFPIEVVDTTGAGDCFAGGYLAALARGLSHGSAARYGNAAGALSASHLGGVDGILSWEEMERWMGNGD